MTTIFVITNEVLNVRVTFVFIHIATHGVVVANRRVAAEYVFDTVVLEPNNFRIITNR